MRFAVAVFGILALGAAAGGAWLASRGASDPGGPEAFRVRRGRLRITVSESGTLQAERMERIRSRVTQTVSILYIIPEGTYISEQDVADGKVLVELDASALKERHVRQQVTVESAQAALTRAREDHQIQLNQNESNIRAAELNVKFAWMELESYVGKELASQLSEQSDFAALVSHEALGGAALQEKIRLESDVRLAEEEVRRAEDRVKWTQQLEQKKYVTKNELRADELALERRKAELEQSKLALELFLTYELPKQAEMRFADWREQTLALERVRARASSEAAQTLARLKSAEATQRIELEQLQKLEQEIQNATIRATKPGLVVYASSTNPWRRSNSPIEEGVSVRERQEIIHLPDLSSMVAEVKVHESVVEQIKPGQRAFVTVDALPELRMEGRVTDVAGLPDPQHWLQDVKVFTTKIAVEGTHPSLRPGMSCRAEIVVATLEDVLYVPIQAVTTRGQQKLCYVLTDRGREARPVETGLFDDRFVQIKDGLEEGEVVVLNPPFLPSEHQYMEPEDLEPEAPPVAREEREPPGAPDGAAEEGPHAAAGGAPQEMIRKLREAGITEADMRRWRSGDLRPEDGRKLRAAGLSDEQVQSLMSRARPPRARSGDAE